jgi:hypothetical protein
METTFQTLNNKFTNAKEWLTDKGFTEIYSNHPSTEPREFHFIKDQVRIKVFIGQSSPIYYCQVMAPVNPYITEPILHISSSKYEIGDQNLFIAHQLVKLYIDKLNKSTTSRIQEVRQAMWEYWFIASAIIFLAYFFVGTLEGSKTAFPNWLPFMIAACINLAICIYKGTKPEKLD